MKIKQITYEIRVLNILHQSESASLTRESTVHVVAEAPSLLLEAPPRFPVSVAEIQAGLPQQSLEKSPGSGVDVRERPVAVAVRLEARQVGLEARPVAEVSPAADE
jgi:hypothetical protein